MNNTSFNYNLEHWTIFGYIVLGSFLGFYLFYLKMVMSKKILIIDDDIQIRMMLREVLEDSGFEVFDAENGEVGISLYKANKPDLVVTDMIMPEKEGIGTLMELIAYDPDLKAIAISGGGKVVKATDVLKDAAFFGAKLVLTKPFTCEEFLNAVKQVLG